MQNFEVNELLWLKNIILRDKNSKKQERKNAKQDMW